MGHIVWVTLCGSHFVGHIVWVTLCGSHCVGHTVWVILCGLYCVSHYLPFMYVICVLNVSLCAIFVKGSGLKTMSSTV